MLIKVILLVWFLVNFEPLQERVERIASKAILKYGKGAMYFLEIPTCAKCLGFWLGLAFTFDFFQAVLISLISYFIDLCLKKLSC